MNVAMRLQSFYRELSVNQIDGLDNLYSQDVQFVDPVNKFDGLRDLRAYFHTLLRTCKHCHFSFHRSYFDDVVGWIEWTMDFAHPRLNGGAAIQVNGLSVYQVKDDKITAQRDYYDLSQMFYEQLPLLGSIIKWLKKRLG